jgi:succinate dehydrogenase / fumarate reductase membrane anchor subunit
MSMTNPLARARGHGSARGGVHHWLAQRVSAVFLVFLVGWLGYAVFSLTGADFSAARAFVARPFNAALLILLVISVFYHAMLGLQVVIEDYVHRPAAAITLHFLVRAGAWLGMALAVVNILIVALGA